MREIVLTEEGTKAIRKYLLELEAKRKEILDARLDTASDTVIPSEADITSDIKEFMDEDGDYYNNFGVTDNYNDDRPLVLSLGKDFTIKEQ